MCRLYITAEPQAEHLHTFRAAGNPHLIVTEAFHSLLLFSAQCQHQNLAIPSFPLMDLLPVFADHVRLLGKACQHNWEDCVTAVLSLLAGITLPASS